MKYPTLILSISFLFSCASKVVRTRDSDKSLRVALIKAGISDTEHSSIQQALVETGKFNVVDRNAAFNAVTNEQHLEHREMSDRFEDSQKFAQWGKMYGVGAVITAHSVCGGAESSKNLIYLVGHLATLGLFDKTLCTEFLELVDTNTAEVLVSVRYEAGKRNGEALDWSDIVDKLVDQYPIYFGQVKKHELLFKYEAESKEEALKQKRVISSPILNLPSSTEEDAETSAIDGR